MSTVYNPTPKQNYIPIVITNNTTLADSDVYVTFLGKYRDALGDDFFFSLTENTSPPMGVYAPIQPGLTTLSSNYSYQLSTLAKSSTGAHDYIVYVPSTPSNRFFFSINSPLYVESDASPNNIAAPNYFAFYDPNYNNLYESAEMAFFPSGGSGNYPNIPWTASLNTTEVDAFGLPIRIQYQSYDPANPSTATPMVQTPNALPSGFGVGGATGVTTRSEVLTSVVGTLTSGDATGQTPKVWPRLAIPFYTDPYAATGLQTYLRVLSPKQSVGGSENPPFEGGLTSQHLTTVQPGPTQFKNYNYPPFPMDYLNNNVYGDSNSFADNLFGHYTSGTSLFISTGGGAPTVYQGVSSGTAPTQVLTFTGVSGPNTGQVSVINETDLNTFNMYSGNQLMSGPDGDDLGFYFGDAFTVGFLGGSTGTANSGPPPNDPINITDAVTWEPYYTPLYYTPTYGFSGGPWYDLYSDSLHQVAVRNTTTGWLNGVGLCYGYDYDDSLGFSGTITPSNLTPVTLSPYLSITLGVIDTAIPDPYSDSTAYDVVFNFPNDANHALEYSQGGAAYVPVTDGSTVTGLVSSRANKLNLHYTNGQGPTGDYYFDVYLYYQFIQPTSAYNGNMTAIINSTTITPDSATPTTFTIALLP